MFSRHPATKPVFLPVGEHMIRLSDAKIGQLAFMQRMPVLPTDKEIVLHINISSCTSIFLYRAHVLQSCWQARCFLAQIEKLRQKC